MDILGDDGLRQELGHSSPFLSVCADKSSSSGPPLFLSTLLTSKTHTQEANSLGCHVVEVHPFRLARLLPFFHGNLHPFLQRHAGLPLSQSPQHGATNQSSGSVTVHHTSLPPQLRLCHLCPAQPCPPFSPCPTSHGTESPASSMLRTCNSEH